MEPNLKEFLRTPRCKVMGYTIIQTAIDMKENTFKTIDKAMVHCSDQVAQKKRANTPMEKAMVIMFITMDLLS